MTSWFVSDIHLKDVNERNGNTLLRFLFFLNKNPKQHRLFLLGDIFDFWLSDGKAFRSHYQVLIDQIAQFKKNGGLIYYFEGNHDFHIDVFWTKYLDIPVYEEVAFFEIDGLKLRLEHGDFINPDDKAYLRYRATVRHPLVEPLGHFLPGWFWKWFGEGTSKKSRKRTSHYASQNSEKMIQMIRDYAKSVYAEKEFDVIVTGHMHFFDDYQFEVNKKKVRSINLGTWLEVPRVLKIENGKLETLLVEDLID